ncbi:hypothetical protein [Enterococcus sp. AZ109]|uniref:hypothetical protein n=1 Tax=Enterococcus sp. AZ109 TaxID=2774634 RepID=UPI003F28880B
MTEKQFKLTHTQIFTMRRKGLENRFSQYQQQEQDDAYLIQCAVAVMVRNAFSPEDFSFIAKDLIRKLFFTSDSLASVRHLCVYFQEYFTKKEWKTVTTRLFTSQKEYLAITEGTRSNTDHLHTLLHSGSRNAKELQNIVTTFKDENGKKHRYTFKNLDPCYSVQITNDLLCILNTLTIFQHNGVRRFTELIRYVYSPTEPVYDSERENETAIRWVEKEKKPQPMEAVKKSAANSQEKKAPEIAVNQEFVDTTLSNSATSKKEPTGLKDPGGTSKGTRPKKKEYWPSQDKEQVLERRKQDKLWKKVHKKKRHKKRK